MNLSLTSSFTFLLFFTSTVSGCGQVVPLTSQDTKEKCGKWLAALYRTDGGISNPIYTCGGTLIDHNKVITASFCVTNRQSDLIEAKDLTVVLGKVHSDWDTVDQHQQKHEVKEIIIHENYQGPLNNYVNAIAVIVLKENVTLTSYVEPACLDLELSADKIQNGSLLHMAGWGYDKEASAIGKNLREIPLSFIDQITCDRISQSFIPAQPPDTFCVLPTSERLPEFGDSGHGVTMDRDGHHYIVGVFAFQHSDGNVTVNIAENLDLPWLKNIMDKF